MGRSNAFFRTGQATIEVIDNKVEGNDQFWGLAWKTKDIRKKENILSKMALTLAMLKMEEKKILWLRLLNSMR